MSRKKLSEYRAKQLMYEALGVTYVGWTVADPKDVDVVSGHLLYVVKVDQAVKGRFKKGLVRLGVKHEGLKSVAKEFFNQGYSSVIIEPQIEHEIKSEKYFSLNRIRQGVELRYGDNGGVDIEKHAETIKSVLWDEADLVVISEETGFSVEQLMKIRNLCDMMHVSFLEINPYILQSGSVVCLDVAIEVDSAAELLVDGWDEDDIRMPSKLLSREEIAVQKLNKDSAASFSLEVINANGSIFLLLSGGGASVVIADEVYNLGSGDKLANYGEYSGNPTEYETHLYTQQVISLLLKSTAKEKSLFIGGAVANFTDIAATFRGIISALKFSGDDLKGQQLKVYVRRGGPHQDVALRDIQTTLSELGVLGGVYDPSTSIPQAVKNLMERVV